MVTSGWPSDQRRPSFGAGQASGEWVPTVSSSSRRRLSSQPAPAASAASTSRTSQPHDWKPEESVAGGGVPWPTLEDALGTGVLDSADGLSLVGTGVGSADDSVGVADSLVGSGVGSAEELVGFGLGVGLAEELVGVGEAASVSDGSGEPADSVGSGDSDSVGSADSVGVSDGDSVGVSDVRLGSAVGSSTEGDGRVGRSLGSVTLPLPHPVRSPITSAEPAAAVRSLERMAYPVLSARHVPPGAPQHIGGPSCPPYTQS